MTHFICAGPTLVGEIITGFVLGPPTLDLVPMTAELQSVGYLALMVVLFERGLYTNLSSVAQASGAGLLMAIFGITLSMTLTVVALRVNGSPFIEAMCAGCVMSATSCGLVDIGWARRQMKDLNPGNSLSSKVVDAATTINAMLILVVMTVMRAISPTAKWYHPHTQWWVCVQPLVFSMAFLVAGIVLRSNFNFFCLKTVVGVFFPPKSKPADELYNALDFFRVTFMTAFALALGVAASVVKVPAIVGIFVAGMCFGGSIECREAWERNTCNLTHWLSRIFFTCSIGFLMPSEVWTLSAMLDGFEVASAAFFGSFIAGALGCMPVLMSEKKAMSNVVLCGGAMANTGELGFIFLLEFHNAGYFSQATLVSLLWGLLICALVCPVVCQVCIFSQGNVLGVDDKYKLREDDRQIITSELGNPTQVVGSKASNFRSSMNGAYGPDDEVPLVYNGQHSPNFPSPKEPSPNFQPAAGPPAGIGGTGFYDGSAKVVAPNQLYRPGTQTTSNRSLPPTLEGTYVDPLVPNNLYAAATGTPNNPIVAVPVSQQSRRSVPSIWADDD